MNTGELFKKIIFTNEELFECFETQSQAYYWAASARKKNQIVMIKKGLYAAVNPATDLPYASKFMVASKLTPSSYVAYHSALEYHGLANQVYNNVYVATKERFVKFDFLDTEYEPVKFTFDEGVDEVMSSVNIRVTGLERTIVDCINNLRLGGGIEELLNAFDFIKKLDANKLLQALALYDKKTLYQKAGYLLRQFAEDFRLPENFFDECRRHIGKSCFYFLKDTLTFGDTTLSAEWNMMAPLSLRNGYLGGTNE